MSGLDGYDLDEVGPPTIEHAMSLAEIVRKVNAAGVALDQVVIIAESCDGCTGTAYLDWAKNWPDGVELTEDERILAPEEVARRRAAAEAERAEREAEAERRAEEAERVANDVTEGW